MSYNRIIYWVLSTILISSVVLGAEFTFDLKRNAEECFYEMIDREVPVEIEYQVSYQLNSCASNELLRFFFLN